MQASGARPPTPDPVQRDSVLVNKTIKDAFDDRINSLAKVCSGVTVHYC